MNFPFKKRISQHILEKKIFEKIAAVNRLTNQDGYTQREIDKINNEKRKLIHKYNHL